MVQGAFSCPGYPGKRSWLTLAQSYAGTPESIGQQGGYRHLPGRIAAARQVRNLGEQRVRQPADTTVKFVQIGTVGCLRPVVIQDDFFSLSCTSWLAAGFG